MKISIIGTNVCPDISNKLSFCAWNINGLSSKCIGSKLQNPDFFNVIDNCDFILLTKIGNCTDLEITGYKSFVQCFTPNQSRKGGRNSGGIALLFKNELDKNILIKKSNAKLCLVYNQERSLKFDEGYSRLWNINTSVQLEIF